VGRLAIARLESEPCRGVALAVGLGALANEDAWNAERLCPVHEVHDARNRFGSGGHVLAMAPEVTFGMAEVVLHVDDDDRHGGRHHLVERVAHADAVDGSHRMLPRTFCRFALPTADTTLCKVRLRPRSDRAMTAAHARERAATASRSILQRC